MLYFRIYDLLRNGSKNRIEVLGLFRPFYEHTRQNMFGKFFVFRCGRMLMHIYYSTISAKNVFKNTIQNKNHLCFNSSICNVWGCNIFAFRATHRRFYYILSEFWDGGKKELQFWEGGKIQPILNKKFTKRLFCTI